MPNKYERKRKKELDADTTKVGAEERRKNRSRSRSKSPKNKSSGKRKINDNSNGDKNEESMSIEETNKLRAKLGLAPLELDDKTNTEPTEKEDGSGEKVFTEYGIEIVHKPSRNWAEEKRQKDLKEKIELKKKQRDVYSKVLKAKRGLAEESDEEDDTKKWVERNRRIEEEMRKAEEKAKQLDEMDEAFGIGGMTQQTVKQKRTMQQKKAEALTSGLMVGHSIQDFSEGRETILVLQDKSILEEDDEEMLINPNMLENERHKLNVERRKKKATHYQSYDEEIDEFGQAKRPEILSKYDEGMDGDAKKRETFRLDATGQYDLEKEAQEEIAKHRLMMINKKFESLDSTKYTLANEFYTEEEIIQFRRPKKGTKSMRKKKALKAEDLVPEPLEETAEEKRIREAKLAARRAERGDSGVAEVTEAIKSTKFKKTLAETDGNVSSLKEVEEGKLTEETANKEHKAASQTSESNSLPTKEKWKKPKASVNIQMLQSLAEKMKKDDDNESDEEEEFPHATNVAPVRIDDEAEDELNAVLAKTRRLKQTEQQMSHQQRMPAIKEEDEEGGSDEDQFLTAGGRGGSIVFDATSEKYKSIGGGYSQTANQKNDVKMEVDDEQEEENMIQDLLKTDKDKKSKPRRFNENDGNNDFGDFEQMEVDREGSERSTSSLSGANDEPGSSSTYTNILGEEKDVTKGVAAMLKLAGQKGYLESGDRRRVGEGTLKHLESKRYSRVEQGRYDIEDKTMRKLERMGTTGTGPTRPFPEKTDYQPKIEINYSDKSGRVLEPKEAFRALSWKFHGKGPGKKQAEKHSMKVIKREKLKKMNSQDTPLGTLNKQLKKQEQLQTPYLLLSGRGDAAPLQKE